MSFADVMARYPWDEVRDAIRAKSPADVERALAAPGAGTPDDFMALVSPAAAAYLEPMAQLSHRLTVERFGRCVQLYVPVYLSNYCSNICTYCGFSVTNKMPRRKLSDPEILREAAAVKAMGYDHILLLTGEWHNGIGLDYFLNAVTLLRPHFANICLEVQPMSEKEYAVLAGHGVHAVYIYQETYDRAAYRAHHPRGVKARFDYRLETQDRLGRAGIHKIGLGCLLGLSDWRADSFFTALHLRYLEETYWRTRYSVSFPRLRPHAGDETPHVDITDREFVQLICAYRIFNQQAELALSTRETPRLRDHLVKLGITTMSAGSMTNPGGYAEGGTSLEQFEISDDRPPAEIAAMIRRQGYEPVWKDWDAAYDRAAGAALTVECSASASGT